MLPLDNANLAEMTTNKSELCEVDPAVLLGEKEMSFRLPLDDNDTAGNSDSGEKVKENNEQQQNADMPDSSDNMSMEEVGRMDDSIDLKTTDVTDESLTPSSKSKLLMQELI